MPQKKYVPTSHCFFTHPSLPTVQPPTISVNLQLWSQTASQSVSVMDRLQQQLVRYEARLAKWRKITLRNRQALTTSATKEAVYAERIRHVKALQRLGRRHSHQCRRDLEEHNAPSPSPPPPPSPPTPPRPTSPISPPIVEEWCFECGLYRSAQHRWTRCWRCEVIRCPQCSGESCACLDELESPRSP